MLNITSIKGDSNLTIFNHWLAGIYKVGECHAEGLGSKKLFDRRSEFVVFDLGSWELQVRSLKISCFISSNSLVYMLYTLCFVSFRYVSIAL